MVDLTDSTGTIKGIDGTLLKIIAVIAMTSDHVALLFFADVAAVYLPARVIGRIAAPIMCCMLAEGYRRTSSLKKYFLRLFAFALLSQIPYSLAFRGTIFDYTDYNVLFTLALALAALALFDRIKNGALKIILPLPVIALSYFCDWGITAPLYAIAFFSAGDDRYKRTAFSIGIAIVYVAVALFTRTAEATIISTGLFLAPIPLFFYNGTRGRKTKAGKWFFYCYYPAHLALLYVITLLV